MNIKIFYFSGTGNTSWTARELVSLLNSAKHAASAVSIERITPFEADAAINESDIVGFGYPIYGSDLPNNMKEFMEALSPVLPKPAFIFCTQWKWSGDGSHAGSVFISKKGFETRWSEHFLMPNNVCAPILPFPYTNDTNKLRPVLERAKKRACKFAGKISDGKTFLRGFNALSQLSGSLQRIPFRKNFSKFRNDISADQKTCSKCGLCVKICPTGNLFSENGVISSKGCCIICLRCYNFCPESAITYRKMVHNKKRGTPYRGPSGRWDGSANSSWNG